MNASKIFETSPGDQRRFAVGPTHAVIGSDKESIARKIAGIAFSLNVNNGPWRAMEDADKHAKLWGVGVNDVRPDRLMDIAPFDEISPADERAWVNTAQQQIESVFTQTAC